MRPLFFADPKDPLLREVDESFLLGDDLLVSAQVDPAAVKSAVLPRGIWQKIGFPLEDGSMGPIEDGSIGPTDIISPDLPALYIRGGSIIPTGPLIQYSSEKPLAPLTLLVCLDDQGRATGSLYEDAGDGLDYLRGAYRLATYRADVTDGKVVVTSTAKGQWSAPDRLITVHVYRGNQEFAGSGKEGQPISIPIPTQ
jgi:alpha-glucosidase